MSDALAPNGIPVTPAIRQRVKILRFAEARVGCDDQSISYSKVEILKVELADEVIAQIERDDPAHEAAE